MTDDTPLPGEIVGPLEQAKRTWPERRVTRTGVSPMNRKVKWAELDCGHEVFRTRRPRVGATIVCDKCSEKLK